MPSKELDPLSQIAKANVGMIYWEKAALSPDPVTMAWLAHAYGVSGQKEKARKILGQLESQAKIKESISGYNFAII